MKYFLLPFLLANALALPAQITVQPSTLPRVGDTLRTAVDNLPSNISMGVSGPNQRWDFSSLQSPFTRQTLIRAASEGMYTRQFPNASMMTPLSDNAEAYYRATSNAQQQTFQVLGLFGKDPVNFGIDVLTKLNPPLVERRAPLQYRDNHHTEAALLLAFSADDLPAAVLNQLPITPDSLRVRVSIDRDDEVDAWGKLVIPGGIYDVLREKRREVRETRVDAKIGFLGWQDITALIPNSEFAGKDTTLYYYFLSNDAKEPIAIATMDATQQRPVRVEYKANDLTTDVQNVKALKPGVYAFPNPAIVNVRFEFSNLPAGNYKLSIYNILGSEVWHQRYYINGQRIEKVDISSLRKGTYLYSLQDDRGRTISTKRLVVVRP